MPNETTALAVREQRTDPAAFEPATTSELMTFAAMVVKSGLAPAEVRTTEAAAIIIATGRELGISSLKALRSIYVVKGRPTLSADLMAALVKRSGACKYWQLVEMSRTVCTLETQRVGDPSPTRYSYSIEDAQAAGLLSSQTWKAHPAAMLKARCTTALARAVYPDLVMGLYDPDELDDPDEPAPAPARAANVTPIQQAARSAQPVPAADFVEAEFEETPAPAEPTRDDLAAAILAVEVRADDYLRARKKPPLAEMDADRMAKVLDYLRSPSGATSLARWRQLQQTQQQPAGDRPADLPGPPAGSLRALRDEYRKLATPVDEAIVRATWEAAAEAEGVDPASIDMKAPWTAGETLLRRVVEALREDEVLA